MGKALKLLAEKKLGTLKPAEREFFQAVAEGRPVDFSSKVDAPNDPAQAEEWGSKRVLRADRIADCIIKFCKDSEAMSSVPHYGIEVKGAKIVGDLNLRSTRFPFPLIFKGCAFDGDINLRNCKIWFLDFSGSHVHSIDCTGSEVEKGIFLRNNFKSNGIVCLEGAKVTGPLDCTGAHFLNPGNTALDADGVKVTGDVLLRNRFRAEGMVSFVEATIRGNLECNQGLFINKGEVAFNAERLDVGGDVFLCKGSWGKDKGVEEEGFRSEGEVKLVGAKIYGTLECRGGIFANPNSLEPALNATDIEVVGNILLHYGFEAYGMVSLVGATIRGNLECNQGLFINKGEVALNAERLNVDGDVFLCKGSWGRDKGVQEEGFKSEGEVKLVGAKICGTLECRGGMFSNSNSLEPALNAKSLDIGGNILLHNGFKAQGMVSLVGATIAGNLECKKGEFTNKGKVALDVERSKIGGDVFLCEESWGEGKNLPVKGFTAEGEVKLVRAVIKGDLNCIGGKFCDSKDGDTKESDQKAKCALRANGLNVKGSVLLSEGFRVKGKVDLVGATIGGNLECNSGEFVNKGDVALDAERVKVGGDVFLRDGCWHRKKPIPDGRFKAMGRIKLIGATIGGTVKCKGASFASEERKNISSEVSLYGATINRDLVWTNIVSSEQAKLDLRFAKVVKLSDDKDSWPDPGNLLLDGLVYDEIDFDGPQSTQPPVTRLSGLGFWGVLVTLWKRLVVLLRGDTKEEYRIEWLRLQGNEFHHQPYEQLVTILRRNGRDNDARTVLIAKARDQASLTHMPFFGRYWHWFLGKTIGYGYRPWRALKISVVVIALGTAIFSIGKGSGIVKQTKVVEYVSAAGTDEIVVHQGYPEFNALVYSLDMFVPLVDLRQATYWLPSAKPSVESRAEPNAEPGGGPNESKKWSVHISVKLLRLYTWIHIITGWILTTLLFAGLSGLVKR